MMPIVILLIIFCAHLTDTSSEVKHFFVLCTIAGWESAACCLDRKGTLRPPRKTDSELKREQRVAVR